MRYPQSNKPMETCPVVHMAYCTSVMFIPSSDWGCTQKKMGPGKLQSPRKIAFQCPVLGFRVALIGGVKWSAAKPLVELRQLLAERGDALMYLRVNTWPRSLWETSGQQVCHTQMVHFRDAVPKSDPTKIDHDQTFPTMPGRQFRQASSTNIGWNTGVTKKRNGRN